MKKLLATALVLMGLAAGQNIQHAPSRSQCTADANLWDRNADELAWELHLSISDLRKRAAAMGTCSSAYPEEVRFHLVAAHYLSATLTRVEHFFDRHPEVKQRFLDEDAEGMR